MKYYIIHLQRAYLRRENVRGIASSMEGEVEIVHAVDAIELGTSTIASFYSRFLHFPPYPFSLKPSEVACFLSHRMVWQRIVDGVDDEAIIIEDDVVIDVPAFRRALALVEHHRGRYDFVRFPFRRSEESKIQLGEDGDVSLFQPRIIGLGTQAQLVTKQAAERLLHLTRQFDRPVDTFLQLNIDREIRTFTVAPAGISECSRSLGGSTIGSKKSAMNKLAHETLRPLYRILLRLWLSVR